MILFNHWKFTILYYNLVTKYPLLLRGNNEICSKEHVVWTKTWLIGEINLFTTFKNYAYPIQNNKPPSGGYSTFGNHMIVEKGTKNA